MSPSDPSFDPEIRAGVDDEFNAIWNSLVADLNSPLKKLKSGSLLSASSSPSSPFTSSMSVQKLSQSNIATSPVKSDTTVTLIKSNTLHGAMQQMGKYLETTF